MKSHIILFCVLTAAGLGWWLSHTRRIHGPQDDNGRRALEYYDQLGPVRVSGTVVDDDDAPLEGVRVELIARTIHFIVGKPSPAQTLVQNTARDGNYHFTVEKPRSIFIRSVSKEGYELDRYANNDMRLDWAHTPSRPLVHKMRKIGEPTFLLQRPSSTVGDVLLWPKAPDSKSDQWSLTNLDSYYDFKSETRDLEGRASYDVQKGEWEITYRAVSVDGGVIMSTQRLFRAPEDGYQREVSFRTSGVGTNTYSRNSQYYLYLKTRKPLLYARVDVEQSIGLNREYPQSDLRILVKSWTNPYGERNFEPLKRTAENFQAQDAHTEYCLQCINEGRRADPKHLADLLAKPVSTP